MQTGQRVVVAVGGNALQRRGDRLTIENMLKAAKQMAPAIMAIQAAGNEVVLTHGNGPQVGELALERSCAGDVLGAESQGQIGYVLCQAFQSLGVDAAAIVTQTLVDAADPAFSARRRSSSAPSRASRRPTASRALAKGLDWTVKQDGEYYRRVVASPKPQAILQLDAVTALLDAKYPLVIAAGGGGAPVSRVFGDIVGVEGVVDKDGTASLMARSIGAQGLIILTDGGGIWEKFGKPDGREMRVVTPQYLRARKSGQKFPGSMGPKVAAAIEFVMESPEPGAWAIIGDLNDAAELMGGTRAR
ncbi:carbamate kinase [Aureococcus anophagefferens]|uniref:Carbamate kinase n=1 Tax=Aureococcus anophagefferens TaxID=44056 RepID=A0ABR1GAQ9_AURAN